LTLIFNFKNLKLKTINIDGEYMKKEKKEIKPQIRIYSSRREYSEVFSNGKQEILKNVFGNFAYDGEKAKIDFEDRKSGKKVQKEVKTLDEANKLWNELFNTEAVPKIKKEKPKALPSHKNASKK
jgi:hypothetical protein